MLPAAILAILIILLAIRTGRRPQYPNCGRRMRKNGRYWDDEARRREIAGKRAHRSGKEENIRVNPADAG